MDEEAVAAVTPVAARMGWQRCPRCGMIVERIDGCNRMRCTCRHVFCYVCGSTWRECGHGY
ncbi:hypothetical protein B0T26DRAFT_632984 [Lasiosphaeria miniovina]|uniref:IBR domain-containing protein n=1 Tax=Lasiosphaeria miniovina TaxID=1954250 RepID=A0AA40BJ56_9PEZI|nr:uncharacterized protein B0T26DRAFT_632984 [Lasiosphaeria miniovina]KAK0735224.1 hypothetical protein B0T26DRAFT_632984 [Lasiosphaeria miniovina]